MITTGTSKKYSDGFWKVYVHINKTNGKKYVGITSQKVEYRWNYGKAYSQSPYFSSAINKYGWDGFDHIVIAESLSESEAKNMEESLIREWHTQDRRFGYNATAGGDGLKGYKPSDELRKKWSELRTGTKRSEETKHRMSVSSALRRPDVKQKSRESKFKKVTAFTPDGSSVGTFESIHDAAAQLGLSSAQRRHISDCCNGNRNTCGGYKWEYA